ncbi:PDZ domain-containing protein [Streptomyces sp. NPDC055189]
MDQTALRPKPMPGQEHGAGGKFGGGGTFGRGAVPGVRRKLGIGRKPGAGRTSGAGRTPGTGHGSGPGHRPHAARRRGRRLVTLLLGLLFSVVLVLSGVGLGTVSATVIGMSKLADMQKQAQGGAGGQAGVPGGPVAPGTASESAAPQEQPSKQPQKQPGKDAGGTSARPALGVEAVDAPGGAGALLAGVHSPGPGHSAGLVRGDVLLVFGGTRIASAKALAAAVAAADPGRNVTVTVRHVNGRRQSLSVTPGFVT